MALYHSDIMQSIGTEFNEISDTRVFRSISGRPRIRNYASQIWRQGVLVHDVNQTDLDRILSFYASNKSIVFTMLYQADGVTYNCQFAGPPKSVPILGGRYDVTVPIIEVV